MAKTKAKEYAEFKFKGDTFDYSGRVYPAKKKGNPFVYLTLNDAITIQVRLIEGKKADFIGWPSYQAKDGEWKSLVYWDESLEKEMDELIEAIKKALESIE